MITTNGQYQHLADPPNTPGLEYYGEIIWAGGLHKNLQDAQEKRFGHIVVESKSVTAANAVIPGS